MWGGDQSHGIGGGRKLANVPNFPHGGNARSLPTLGQGGGHQGSGGRKSPVRAYGRPLTKRSKIQQQQRRARNPHATKHSGKGGGLMMNSGNGEDSNSSDEQDMSAALSRSNLVALASMSRPPPAVVLVSATVMILLSPGETVPEDLMWSSLRREIAETDIFLRRIATVRHALFDLFDLFVVVFFFFDVHTCLRVQKIML